MNFYSNTPIFGRTDLRKGVSEAKFDAEADFDVKKSLAPPKSAENREKAKTIVEKFRDFFSVFRDFLPILEELRIFGRQNQLLHQILLQIHPS